MRKSLITVMIVALLAMGMLSGVAIAGNEGFILSVSSNVTKR